MEKNLFNRDKFEELKKDTILMNDSLSLAFQHGKKFLEMLVDTKLWAGKSKDEFQCFFHLVMQYHGQLVGEEVISLGNVSTASIKGKPCEIAKDTLTNFNQSMDQFTGNCESYQELEKI
jgi:hypothetical protein